MGEDIPSEWWTLFHSDALNALICQGLANSPNLVAAQATLSAAEENLRAQIGSTMLPSISEQLDAERERFNGATLSRANRAATFNVYTANTNISYTLDVFGGERRQIEALEAQVDYEHFELEAAYLTLTSNIVTSAINVASLQAQIDATQKLIQAQEQTLEIVNQQFQLGGASEADVLTQTSQLAQTRATLPPLEQSLAQAKDALAVLVGAFPSNIQIPNINLDQLTLPGELPVSLPCALVRQRPDIRAQEALAHAAMAQIGVATANLYPQITITGSEGWTANSLANFFSLPNNIWNYTGQLVQPLFEGGSLRAKRRAAIDTFHQVAAQYKQTVLQAFQNVADTLQALQNDAIALQAQQEAESSAHSSLILLQKQYQLGGVSYLSLLTAERTYEQARISYIQAQAARYSDTAALFQALGGGWWNRC